MLARRLEAFIPPSLFLYTDIASEQVPDGEIPASWSARLGTYQAEGLALRDTVVAPSAQLLESNGVLVLDLGGERQVLQPVSESLAFPFGLGGPLPAVGKGDPVTALGGDAFTYLGVRYRRVRS
jgi:hypothetical protein